ncbi:MurR/RpiR family transcriptional regulator [Brevibacterium sp. 1718]|uniref:MurR/RpiR family transcriptional regulator n=1 Tax=Brevibacterium sp. 1718 TaxID=3413510 RepID=UPI003DA7DED5
MNDTVSADSVTSDTKGDSALHILRSRITDAWESMSKAERTACSFLLRSTPEHLLYASAATLGSESGTSNATIVRTFQKLGYSGLSDLKRELAAPFTDSVSPEERLKQRISHLGESFDESTASVWTEAEELIELARGTLSSTETSRSVDIIARARRSFVYGIGLSSVAALHLSLRLRRVGLDSTHLVDDGFLLADQLLPIGADDVLIMFVPGRLTPVIDSIVEHARALGCPIVFVTDELGESMRDRTDAVLQVPRTPTGISDESFIALLVADIIIQGIATVAPEAALGASHSLNRLRRRLGY